METGRDECGVCLVGSVDNGGRGRGWTAPRFARSLIPTEVSEDDDVEDDFDASGDFVQ